MQHNLILKEATASFFVPDPLLILFSLATAIYVNHLQSDAYLTYIKTVRTIDF